MKVMITVNVRCKAVGVSGRCTCGSGCAHNGARGRVSVPLVVDVLGIVCAHVALGSFGEMCFRVWVKAKGCTKLWLRLQMCDMESHRKAPRDRCTE